jgi:hypothetical protein
VHDRGSHPLEDNFNSEEIEPTLPTPFEVFLEQTLLYRVITYKYQAALVLSTGKD